MALPFMPFNDPANAMMTGIQFGVDPNMMQIFQDVFTRQAGAKQQANRLFDQYNTAATTPAEQVDPTKELLANLFGNMSQAIAPQMGGQQVAKQAISIETDKLKEKRLQTLDALHRQYGKAAAEAEALGNTADAIKMHSAQAKIQKELTAEADAKALAKETRDHTFEMKKQDSLLRGQAGIAAAHDRRAIEQSRLSLEESYVRAGYVKDPSGAFIPKTATIPTANWLDIRQKTAAMLEAGVDGKPYPDAEKMQIIRDLYSTPLTSQQTKPETYVKWLRDAPRMKQKTKDNKFWFDENKDLPIFTTDEIINRTLANYPMFQLKVNAKKFGAALVAGGIDKATADEAVAHVMQTGD